MVGNSITLLIYIGYDADGNAVGKYFPCNPQDLEWHYSWYEWKGN